MSTPALSGDLPDACCKNKPAPSEYSPKGTKTFLGDLPIYAVGDKSSIPLLVISDIFGDTKTALQIIDQLSASGFYCVFPCYFRDQPFLSIDGLDVAEVRKLIGERAPDDLIVADIKAVIHQLKADGVKKINILGICWGAKIMNLINTEGLCDKAATTHPAMLTVESCANIKAPLFIINSGQEADHAPIIESLKSKPFASENKLLRWDEMHHGFFGTRAKLDDAANIARIKEAISLLKEYFS